jgi:hypothetical protein
MAIKKPFGLCVYNGAIYRSPKEAAKNKQLYSVEYDVNLKNIGAMADAFNVASKALMFAGSAFEITCGMGDGTFNATPWELDRSATLQSLLDPAPVFTFEEVRDALPVIADLIKDGGDVITTRRLFGVSQSVLMGDTIFNWQAKELREFLDEVKRND